MRISRKWLMRSLFALSTVMSILLVWFVVDAEFRRSVAEPIIGPARTHGTMHLDTPLEKVHQWLASPRYRAYTGLITVRKV